MQNTWLTLLPPLIVLVAAIITRHITISLIIGIMSAGFIANDFTIYQSLKSIVEHVLDQFKDVDNYFFIGLIFCLGFIISLLSKSGGIQALGNIITRKSKNKISAESSSLILSFILFIDDYLNMLTVGHVMRPITDQYKIPRVKLAYFAATLAGVLAIMVPISTWLGVIIGQLSSAGISLEHITNPVIIADPFFVYLQSLPFTFYSIITIFALWFIVRKQISYGPMAQQEEIAEKTGNVFGGKAPISTINIIPHTKNNHISDFLVPILTLISSILIGIPYSGSFYVFGGNNTLLKAFQTANTPKVLFISGILAFLIGFIYALLRRKTKLSDIKELLHNGFKMMIASVMLIVLAWIFGSFLKQDLKTGQYLASILIGSININFLPLMVFLVSWIIGMTIGSTWGTIAIMVPIIIPMIISFLNLSTPVAIENLAMLFPCLGAIFSGSVAGNHLSPISDSTIMSASSAGAYTTDLLKVRYYYTIPVIIGTSLSFLLIGFLIKYKYLGILIALVSGILVTLLNYYIINQQAKK